MEREPRDIMKKMWFPYLFPVSRWPHIRVTLFSSSIRETHPLGKGDVVAWRVLLDQAFYFSDMLPELKVLLQSVLLFFHYLVFNF